MARITFPNEKHLTASILIVTKSSPKKILLVHHKKYNKWIQPGGHVELFENPIEAVVRETKEETGLDVSFLFQKIKRLDDIANLLPNPDFFIDAKIAAYEDTPEHFHLDMMYLVELPEQEVQVAKGEAHDIGWFTLIEAVKLPTFENTKVILQQIL